MWVHFGRTNWIRGKCKPQWQALSLKHANTELLFKSIQVSKLRTYFQLRWFDFLAGRSFWRHFHRVHFPPHSVAFRILQLFLYGEEYKTKSNYETEMTWKKKHIHNTPDLNLSRQFENEKKLPLLTTTPHLDHSLSTTEWVVSSLADIKPKTGFVIERTSRFI